MFKRTAIIASLIPSLCFAQEVELPGVTVTPDTWDEAPNLSGSLGADLAPGTVPITATSLDESYLQRRGALSLRDAIEYIPGVTADSTSGINEQFNIRGFDSLNGGTVLIDGVLELETSMYPTYNLQQIDVLKGTGVLPVRPECHVPLP